MENAIRIRPIRHDDVQIIQWLLFEVFAELFYSLSSLTPRQLRSNKVVSEMSTTIQLHSGHFVAETNGAIMGVISIKNCKSPRSDTLRVRCLLRLFSQFGVVRSLKIALGYTLLEKHISKGEYYIEHLGVGYSYRSKGIGEALLQHAESLALSDPNATTLTLTVAKNNLEAIKLYKRRGFTTEAIERSCLSQFLFNTPEWLHMSKSLALINKSLVQTQI